MKDSPVGSILLLALTVLVMPLLTMAQQPVQVWRIAFLGFGSLPSAAEPNPFTEAFRQALHTRGWVEGHTITIEWRWAEGSGARFATLVAELVQLPVEVLVVPNATTAGIARRATTDAEIKAGQAMYLDPVEHTTETTGTTEARGLLVELK